MINFSAKLRRLELGVGTNDGPSKGELLSLLSSKGLTQNLNRKRPIRKPVALPNET